MGGHASEALSERTPEMDEQVEGPGNGDDLAFNAEKTPGEATQDASRRELIAAACCTARPVCSALLVAGAAARVSSRKMDRVQALLTGTTESAR